MKKFLLLIFFLFVSLISVNEVKAGVLEDPYSTFATFQIAWHDDGDKLGFRPDEVTLKYEDLVNIKHSYEITFTKENVEVIKVNDEITIWSRRVPVYKDPQDGMRIRYTENFRSDRYSYPLGSSDVMTLEDKIFQRYSPNFDKLKEYGFVKDNNSFKLEKLFKDDLFKAVIVINSDKQITGTVYDLEGNDEFLPLRLENQQGSFVGEVREEYVKILEDIREKCFTRKYYISELGGKFC